jgi:hypothetical protein
VFATADCEVTRAESIWQDDGEQVRLQFLTLEKKNIGGRGAAICVIYIVILIWDDRFFCVKDLMLPELSCLCISMTRDACRAGSPCGYIDR